MERIFLCEKHKQGRDKEEEKGSPDKWWKERVGRGEEVAEARGGIRSMMIEALRAIRR
jgi:hypothetical protein